MWADITKARRSSVWLKFIRINNKQSAIKIKGIKTEKWCGKIIEFRDSGQFIKKIWRVKHYCILAAPGGRIFEGLAWNIVKLSRDIEKLEQSAWR